jgi:hypothetical protein
VATVISLLVIGAICGLLLALVRRIRTTARVAVLEDVTLAGHAAAVEPALVAALVSSVESLRGARYDGVPGRHVVVLRRTPAWVVVPVCLLFPVGLVFLLVREDVRLDVALFDGPHGGVARLSGHTERQVLERLRNALSHLGRAQAAQGAGDTTRAAMSPEA